jgi:hypothetical protein
LLPSGPGGVRRIPLRGAQPSTPSRTAHSTRSALEREFNPAVADCGLQGTATSPSSTAKIGPSADKGPSASAGPFSPPGHVCDSFTRATWFGGGGGIRTHGTVARTRHFQCRTFGHSATPPRLSVRSNWRRGEDLNPRGTCAPIRFRVGRLQPGSATPPRNSISILDADAGINLRLSMLSRPIRRETVRKSTPAMTRPAVKVCRRRAAVDPGLAERQ